MQTREIGEVRHEQVCREGRRQLLVRRAEIAGVN
jgi:hypothetical protein